MRKYQNNIIIHILTARFALKGTSPYNELVQQPLQKRSGETFATIPQTEMEMKIAAVPS